MRQRGNAGGAAPATGTCRAEEMGREGTGARTPLPSFASRPSLPSTSLSLPPPVLHPRLFVSVLHPFSPLFSSPRLPHLQLRRSLVAKIKTLRKLLRLFQNLDVQRDVQRDVRWGVCGMCRTCGTCGWSGRVAWCGIVGIDNVWEEGIGKRIEYTGSRVQIELGELNGP